MPDIVLSEAEAERIVALPKQVVGFNLWKQGDDGNWYVRMPVESGEQLPLHLYGRFNPRTHHYTFIIFLGRLNLRRLDIGRRHPNPKGSPGKRDVGIVHKHTWTDLYQNRWAYEPEDMKPSDSIAQTFHKFRRECNIALEGIFVEPPRTLQGRLI